MKTAWSIWEWTKEFRALSLALTDDANELVTIRDGNARLSFLWGWDDMRRNSYGGIWDV